MGKNLNFYSDAAGAGTLEDNTVTVLKIYVRSNSRSSFIIPGMGK